MDNLNKIRFDTLEEARGNIERIIHHHFKGPNLIDADWDRPTILGLDNGWRRQVELATSDIVSKLSSALSSPNHADAGKVEGNGWTVEYEVYSGDEWQAASYDFDGAAGYAVMYAAEGLENIAIHEVRRRIVTSAPASEGAE